MEKACSLMAVDLRIRFAPGDEQKLLSLLDPARYEWAMKQSINRTAANVNKFALKIVARDMGLKVADIRKRSARAQTRRDAKGGEAYGAIGISRRASRRSLEANIRGSGRPWNVTRWSGEPVREGKGNRQTATSHRAYGDRQIAERTWMLETKSGRPIVVRKGKSFRGVFGPGVAQQMGRPDMEVRLQRFANRRFRIHWRSRLAHAFESRGMPRG